MTRITDLMTSQTVLANINNDLNQLTTTTGELSSGLSISKPSDNPYGASLAMQLNGAISSFGQYSTNVQDGQSWTSTADSSLTQINNVVQRVRELVVQAANGSESQTDRAAIASEVNQLIAQVKQEGNAQYAGSYIFGGTATQTPPYLTGANDAYQGNNSAVSRQIAPNTTVQVNVDLSTLLGSGQGSGDGLLLDTLRTVSGDLTGGTAANLTALQTTDLQNIDGNLTTLQGLQAQVGATSDRLTLASSRITTMTASDQKALAADQDVDIATASTQYATEQAGYTAALKAGAAIVQSSLLDFLTAA
jgi:flagellar hook-associated protein 3 FlgL